MHLPLWSFHRNPPMPHRVVVGMGLALTAMFLNGVGHAQTYVKIDPQGQPHWASHPTGPDYQFTQIGAIKPPVSNPGTEAKRDQPLAQQRALIEAQAVRPLVEHISQRHGMDPALVLALIDVESSFNPRAVSPKGARGLMQLMPDTARAYGMRDPRELHIPEKNLDFGIRHLKDLLQAHNNNWALTLAAYNAGRNAVQRHGMRIPAYNETLIYVPSVLARVDRHRVRPSQPD
ncbi:lytic transglycosylase domain-containing protein [Hydrogenophaga taeniospiralis]|uniref:lytic transglycosylase domain-containing protein n=1 Tax=Hydrogenophaga taeniospiralis TaxID=65656 RepID=UPI001CFBB31E|nr:lytic transglycosylase domain-containing protein [Hydrogenophaga taeniospiralis]MCB4363305.1 lytic transglycosylase domain-containing protein [Hydrogenophaga taeniospiralis]